MKKLNDKKILSFTCRHLVYLMYRDMQLQDRLT